MGKDLRGRELGKGISQRKDGRFSARYVSKTGKRIEKYFDTVPQTRNWYDKAKREDENTNVAPFDLVAESIVTKDADVVAFNDMTVNQWFEFWIEHIVGNRAYNTKRNYRERYERSGTSPYMYFVIHLRQDVSREASILRLCKSCWVMTVLLQRWIHMLVYQMTQRLKQ